MGINLFQRKSKRGNVPIIFLVVLTVILTIYTLFTFSTNMSKISIFVGEATFVDFFNYMEDSMEENLRLSMEDAIVKSYDELVTNGEYLGVQQTKGGYSIFSTLNGNLNEVFLGKVKTKVGNDYEGYVPRESWFLILRDKIRGNKYKMEILEGGEIFKLDVEDFLITQASDNQAITISHKFKGEVEVDLKKIGLESFDYLYGVKEACKTESNIEQCLKEKLISSDVELNGNVVEISSKKKFFVRDSFKEIKFSFIIE